MKYASADKVVLMKDGYRRQALGECTGVHFVDLNSISYDIHNIMKFDLNISTKVRFNPNKAGLFEGSFPAGSI